MSIIEYIKEAYLRSIKCDIEQMISNVEDFVEDSPYDEGVISGLKMAIKKIEEYE